MKLKKSSLDSVVDFITSAGGLDRKKPSPPVKNTPVGNPRLVKPKAQLVPEATPSTSRRLTMATRTVSDQSNTEEFNVVEQNSEKVNIADISKSQAIAPVVLELSVGDGLKTLQAFISSGKKFSEAITKARSSGKKFIRAMGLIINIQTEPDQITHKDLTKQRTMALCHRILFVGWLPGV